MVALILYHFEVTFSLYKTQNPDNYVWNFFIKFYPLFKNGETQITTQKLNYKVDDMVSILKTDAFKNKDDEYIESFVKKQLKLYDSIGGKK